jgi:hypothetical protein
MMSDTCGPMYEMPLAQYDPDERCWKTSEVTSLWALPMSSLTLPAWGYLHDGALFEQPTPEPLTTAHDFSSLPTPTCDDAKQATRASGSFQSLTRSVVTLPTPTAQAAKHTLDDRGVGTPDDANLWSVAGRLLPTLAVNDMGAGKDPEAWREWAARQKAADGRPAPHGKSLEQEALKMLPTPRAQDEYERRNYKTMVRIRDEGGDMTLPTWATVVAPSLGDNTQQQSHAGNTSLGEQHQPQLFESESATG